MSNSANNGTKPQEGDQGYTNPPDLTPRREGGDDAIAERISADANADEKVIDNRGPGHSSAEPLQEGKSL